MSSSDLTWSDWLDFDEEHISKIPQAPGVFRMHVAMKILYIGEEKNLQESLMKLLENPCTKEDSRFCYSETSNHKQLRGKIVKEYLEKHDGKLPKCMQTP